MKKKLVSLIFFLKVHERELKIEDVTKSEGEQVVSVALHDANAGTAGPDSEVAGGNGNDLSVWNIIRQFNASQVPEEDEDVHQIIYVTYQDPEDPNSKVSKTNSLLTFLKINLVFSVSEEELYTTKYSFEGFINSNGE